MVAVCLSSALVGGNWTGGLCGWIGKALLYMMLWIMFSSVLYSSSCRLYVFSLLYRNLIAAYLCWAGWFEVYGVNWIETSNHCFRICKNVLPVGPQ